MDRKPKPAISIIILVSFLNLLSIGTYLETIFQELCHFLWRAIVVAKMRQKTFQRSLFISNAILNHFVILSTRGQCWYNNRSRYKSLYYVSRGYEISLLAYNSGSFDLIKMQIMFNRNSSLLLTVRYHWMNIDEWIFLLHYEPYRWCGQFGWARSQNSIIGWID